MPAIRVGVNDINKECIVLHREQKIFLPVSKVANTSIKQALIHGRDKTDFSFVTKDIVLREYRNLEKVAVVRNPFERLVSCYSYFEQKRPDYFRSRVQSIKYSDFPGFIEAIYNEPDEIANCHYRSQYNLLSQDGVFLPDIVIGYERIELVKDYLPIQKLHTYDRTTSRHGAYQEYYDDRLIRMVNERFHKDLTFFGYEYDLPTTGKCSPEKATRRYGDFCI